MKPLLLLLALVAGSALRAAEPASIPLWPGGAPGSEGKNGPEKVVISGNGERQVSSIHQPSLTPYLPTPALATGAAVLVIPGGGHRVLCVDHEGAFVAQWLAEHGVAAFVLKHRLAREEGSTYTIEGEALADTQRAVRLIRARAAEWQVDPRRVGAMGFSAGGELVALAWMHPSPAQPEAADPLDRPDARIAFQGLIYPGRTADIQPTKEAPPAFLLCGEKDRTDIAEGLPETYLRFKRAGLSAELHVYANAGHGFGFRPTTPEPLAGWPTRFLEWLSASGFLSAKS